MSHYCESIYQTKRRKTREVMVGPVGVGGNHPIRIQSMTTSNTRDAEATIEQIVRLADIGCEIARVTVQGIKEAEACELIKNGLLQRGYTIPLVADIHFYPPAAMLVAEFVDKIRINPGNFVDKRASFKVIEYDEASYARELEKIEEKFTPLVEKCKRLKRAMRIGTNHGSLSDRIMNRYGDSPRGMVESALEFARICRKNDFHDIIFSMKASSPHIMIAAYRLLSAEMLRLGWDYPLHLGVTEAGEGEDGRVKSAMGMGTLLLDGLGDTIRVSLTEDPWYEIDPCQRLVKLAENSLREGIAPFEEKYRNFANIQRREVILPKNVALHRDGTVILGLKTDDLEDKTLYKQLGCDIRLGQPKLTRTSVDCLALLDDTSQSLPILQKLKDAGVGLLPPLLSVQQAITTSDNSRSARFVLHPMAGSARLVQVQDEAPSDWKRLKENPPDLIIFFPSKNRLHRARQLFDWLQEQKISSPVILRYRYDCSPEDLVIRASAECGALFCDGLADGLWLEGPYEMDFLRNLSFGILQAARMRTSKTDFISCPSCGRTLFNLQEVSQRIRERTSHLPGVKIAIMGCIVNGPGEMADADFGYVGSKPGMIDLYVGKQCVERDINFAEADDRLVSLIKQHGRWIEKDPLDT